MNTEPEKPVNNITSQINESLQETLIFLKQTGGAAIDFSKEQVPLYVSELLNYNFTMSLAYFLIGIVCLFVIAPISGYFMYWFTKEENLKKNYKGYNEVSELIMIMIPFVTGLISLIMGLFMTFENVEWVKIKMAPRVYLVEEIKRLVR